MKDTKLSMVKGDTLAFGVEIEGLDQDLATAYFSCKNDPNDDEGFAVWDPNTPGSSFDGVRVTTYNGNNSGKFQAGTEYVWFILWK